MIAPFHRTTRSLTAIVVQAYTSVCVPLAPCWFRSQDIHPVIDHDRGGPISPPGKNSPIKPVLPPRLAG